MNSAHVYAIARVGGNTKAPSVAWLDPSLPARECNCDGRVRKRGGLSSFFNESTEVQTLGAVYTTREERHRCTLPCPYGRDVLLLTCVILSERGIIIRKFAKEKTEA